MPRIAAPHTFLALTALIAGALLALPLNSTAFADDESAPAKPAAPAQADSDLPSVDDIYENCIKAAGGREAVDAVKTLHAKVTVSMMGMQMPSEQSWSREGGRMMKSTMMGEMIAASDGTTAWNKSPMGYALASEQEAEQLESQTGMFMFVIDFKKFAKDDMQSLEVVGEEAFDGKPCYKLQFTSKEENQGHVYFDKETGLPAGLTQQEKNEQGEPGDKATMFLKEWKEVGGVKFFHLAAMEIEPAPNSPSAGMAGADGKIHAELIIDELEVNTLDAKHFELPEEVKALVKEKESQPEPAADDDSGATDPAPEIKLEDLTEENQVEATKMIENMKKSGMIKAVLPQLESGIAQAEGDTKKMIQYVVQELKKELEAQGR